MPIKITLTFAAFNLVMMDRRFDSSWVKDSCLRPSFAPIQSRACVKGPRLSDHPSLESACAEVSPLTPPLVRLICQPSFFIMDSSWAG